MLKFNEFRKEKMSTEVDYDVIADAYAEYFKENIAVGDGVTVLWWTDQRAYTVVGKTNRTLTLRRCKAIKDPGFKPEYDALYCTNNHEQSYTYEEDESGEIVKARWSTVKRGYYVDGCLKVTCGRSEFYDYNF